MEQIRNFDSLEYIQNKIAELIIARWNETNEKEIARLNANLTWLYNRKYILLKGETL